MTRLAHTQRSLLDDSRGVAMAEGLILAFFFLIVFAAMSYMHNAYFTKIDTMQKNRACAWAYANHGCKADVAAVTRVCGGASYAAGMKADGISDSSQQEIDSAIQNLGTARKYALEVLNQLGLIGESTTVTMQSEEYQRPTLMGGGAGRSTARYKLLCNEEEREPIEVAGKAFCGIVNAATNGNFPGC